MRTPKKRIKRTGSGSKGNVSCSHLGLLVSDSCLYDSYPEILPVLLPEIHKREASRKPSKDQELDAGEPSGEQEMGGGKPSREQEMGAGKTSKKPSEDREMDGGKPTDSTNNPKIRSQFTSPNSCFGSPPLIPTPVQICDKRIEETHQNAKKRPGKRGQKNSNPEISLTICSALLPVLPLRTRGTAADSNLRLTTPNFGVKYI